MSIIGMVLVSKVVVVEVVEVVEIVIVIVEVAMMRNEADGWMDGC
jgi:hypothetical protein